MKQLKPQAKAGWIPMTCPRVATTAGTSCWWQWLRCWRSWSQSWSCYRTTRGMSRTTCS